MVYVPAWIDGFGADDKALSACPGWNGGAMHAQKERQILGRSNWCDSFTPTTTVPKAEDTLRSQNPMPCRAERASTGNTNYRRGGPS